MTILQGKSKSFHTDVGVGGSVALWKSILITGKTEIDGDTVQIEMRGVVDKRRLDYVAKEKEGKNPWFLGRCVGAFSSC